MGTATVNDISDTDSTEGTDRRVSCKSTTAARPLGVPVFLITQFLDRDRVAGGLGERISVRDGIGHEHQP